MKTSKPIPTKSERIDLTILENHLDNLDLSNNDNLNFWLYCNIAMKTGLRSVDILEMKTSYVRPSDRTAVFTEKKTKKPIRVRIPSFILDKINFENEYIIFNHKYKTNVSLMTINRRLKEIYKGEVAISSHSIRKSVAHSIYTQTKNDIIKAMIFLNHSSPVVTKKYLGISEEERLALYDLL
jgi:integrase